MYHIVVSNKKYNTKKNDINIILNNIIGEKIDSKVIIYNLCENKKYNNTVEVTELDSKFLFENNNIINFEYISRVIKDDTKFISLNLTKLDEEKIDILFNHLAKYLGIKENLQYIIYIMEDSYLQNYSQKIKDFFFINSLNYNKDDIQKIKFNFKVKNLLIHYTPNIIKKIITKFTA